MVDLNGCTCSCRRWDLTGFPCIHGCSAIYYARRQPEEFVSSWYKKEKYFEAYENLIQPVQGMKFWEPSENKCIIPPSFKRQPGRPKKRRHREGDENEFKLSKRGQKSVKCSVCKASGHNKARCPTTHPPPAARKGRKSKKNEV